MPFKTSISLVVSPCGCWFVLSNSFNHVHDICVILTDMVRQGLELSRKPHIVIATPGRLADHLKSSNTFSLEKIKFMVR